MLLGTLGASILGNLLTGKAELELVKALLKQVRSFQGASSFNKFLNTKVLSRRIIQEIQKFKLFM